MPSLAFAIFLGLAAGLLPVYVGLIPLWFLRRISDGWRGFLVSVSLGVLLFLFVDVTGQGLNLANAGGLNPYLFVVGLILGVFGPVYASRKRRMEYITMRAEIASVSDRRRLAFFTAYMVALGIGLHNLGEGLAIGASYSANQLVLTSVLVIGFALHNGTEGFGIAAPLSSLELTIKDPIYLGLVAGFPTVIGSVLGYAVYSNVIGALFFSVAAGALLYVIVELIRIANVFPRVETIFSGILIGMLLMYATNTLLSF